MMLTVVGFLLIGVSATYALIAFAALDERPPPSESVAQKLRSGLVGAALLLVPGLVLLESLPLIMATVGVLLLIWSSRREDKITSFVAVALMGLSVVIQYSWVFQPSS